MNFERHDSGFGRYNFGRLERLTNRVLKQRRRLRKRQLKVHEFALLQTFIALIPFRLLRQMLANVFEFEF